MLSDIDIAKQARLLNIKEIAEGLDIDETEIEPYGHYKAKLSQSLINRLKSKKDGKLILVTAINPTPAGEGKTTISVGLSQALNRLGKKSVLALREPSLGPVFGIKGGAAGGGYSQVVPMEDINLHFTGDMHAITSANNLLCALIDNHIQMGNELGIDVRRIFFKRCLDMNDRSLRNIVIGLGAKVDGIPREDHFQITVASEIMAILCLADDINDLKKRLGDILVAYSYDNKPIYARDLNAVGAMAALLKDAINPNLVQTLENTPAIIHGGPFANIAHGCNSVRATKLALKLSEFAVTEAGFGSDLGAEKFFDIKCRKADLKPDCVVIVATVRALKYNGGVQKSNLTSENLDALEKGLCNLTAHIENMRKFGAPVVVAINRFLTDSEKELAMVEKACKDNGSEFALAEVFAKGGEGGISLAEKVISACEKKSDFSPIYDLELSIEEKIEKLNIEIYGGKTVSYSAEAKKALADIKALGFDNLPICVAKTQYSLSDNPELLGRPHDFTLNIRDLRVSAGAGFVVVYTGNIMTMPGLPRVPAANNIDVNEDCEIIGLF